MLLDLTLTRVILFSFVGLKGIYFFNLSSFHLFLFFLDFSSLFLVLLPPWTQFLGRKFCRSTFLMLRWLGIWILLRKVTLLRVLVDSSYLGRSISLSLLFYSCIFHFFFSPLTFFCTFFQRENWRSRSLFPSLFLAITFPSLSCITVSVATELYYTKILCNPVLFVLIT